MTEEEKERWAHLIDARHGFANLVLMCREHSYLIDEIVQGFSVEDVVDMKRAHEAAVEAARRAEQKAAEGEARGTRPAPQPRPVILDDAGEWQEKSVLSLAEADPDALVWLREEIAGTESGTKLQGLVRRWPAQLVDGVPELLIALAREVEARGLWKEASDVWVRLADRTADPEQRGDRLIRAAIDSGMAGEMGRRAELLDAAEELAPNSVRLGLERMEELNLGPQDQLDYLDDLDPDDASLKALVAAQRALANLMLPDLPAARKAVQEALEFEPDSVAAQTTAINLKIQEARLAVVGDRQFVMADVLSARDSALDLRRRLMDMRRWEEASRLLMMAAEVMGMLRDPTAARQILDRASREELVEAPLGAEVLGDSALRMDAADLALRFTEDAPRTDAIERIRATAEVDLPGQNRAAALEKLEELALEGGPEAEFAAASRLLACLPPVGAQWSDQVAEVLAGGDHETMASRLKAMALARSEPATAKCIALEQPKEPWAAELRLRVGRLIRDDKMTSDAADEFSQFGPDASGTLLIGQAFASIGDHARARSSLIGLVSDPNSAPQIRSEAYEVLMAVLASTDLWEEAKRIWNEWADFATRDCPSAYDRVSAWQVRVVHHNRSS